jgi:hypothetical protein
MTFGPVMMGAFVASSGGALASPPWDDSRGVYVRVRRPRIACDAWCRADALAVAIPCGALVMRRPGRRHTPARRMQGRAAPSLRRRRDVDVIEA